MKTDPMIEKKIDELLSVMSLTEKVGQLNQISSPRQDDEEIFESIEDIWPDYPSKDDFFFNEDEY